MKALTLFVTTVSSAIAQNGVLNLTSLHEYANQGRPAYIVKDNTTAGNPISNIGATLGRVLFYDPRLSANETVSCSSCHRQEHGFGDPDIASTGVAGMTGRHSMRLINSRFAAERRFFWDERAVSLEDQVTRPIQDHVEMGFSGADGDLGFSDLVMRLEAIELYQVLFTALYGDGAITEERVQQALAQFVRSIQSFDSKYDEGLTAANNPGAPFINFTAQENDGKRLFMSPPNAPGGGAGCNACHQAPEFDIDPNSGHNGVTGSLGGGQDLTVTRAPSLRDVVSADGSPHGGFMHNASLTTLLDVVNHYNAIPALTAGLDPRLAGPPPRPGGPPPQPQRLNLSQAQKESLVAFMETLTGSSVYSDEKWSSPFGPDGGLSVVVLTTDETQVDVQMGIVTPVVTVKTPGVPRTRYLLKTSEDMVNWSEGTPVTATASGLVLRTMPATQKARYFRFVYEAEAE
ncbi:hypothetical protein N9A94_06745 [Akkermansiaceae bacterium]|nr:hypothetical protein [Akkermansiaceae bacterium]MDA7888634.1 hypothetical protein [Akkermansiaceae bacterium]MDB4537602.1 hypothetical protein [Akkermansiaceae bacterium]